MKEVVRGMGFGLVGLPAFSEFIMPRINLSSLGKGSSPESDVRASEYRT